MNDFKDGLIKIIDNSKSLRIWIADTTNLVKEAQNRHQLSPYAAGALGKLLTAAVMLASDLKNEADLLTISIAGGAYTGKIIATANNRGKVRGLIENQLIDIVGTSTNPFKTAALIGKNAHFEVSKDTGLKIPFSSRTEVISGEIDEDLAYYFRKSEQIRSRVFFEVWFSYDMEILTARGLFFQALPLANVEIIDEIEQRIDNLRVSEPGWLSDTSIESVAEKILKTSEYEIIGRQKLCFECNCSLERMLIIMCSFSSEQLDDMYEDESIEIVCNFCNSKYILKKDDIENYKFRLQ